jgi:pyridoxine 5-phosphate synthase
MPCLTVVVDQVAGLRESMHTGNPDPVAAAIVAELAGADGIGVHLREDRLLIQERDLRLLRQVVQGRLIVHMAATPEMVGFALDIKPQRVVLVPDVDADTPPEDGLDLVVQSRHIFETVDTLQSNGISVGICIAPEPEQAKLAHQIHATWVQIHAGRLQAATTPNSQAQQLANITDTVKLANKLRLHIAVGHGLDHRLIRLFSGLNEIDEFSVGQNLIARAVLKGMGQAVTEIIDLIQKR